MDHLTFDSMAALYDETRTVDAACLEAALAFLAARFPPSSYCRLLEPGVGSGRIAFPLVGRGYAVVGVDVSRPMLALLQERSLSLNSGDRPQPLLADAVHIPFIDGAFHLAVAVHLFYFIARWRQAVGELLRVVRPGGILVLLHTGTGMEVPRLNERYRDLCAEQGVETPTVGVSSTREVAAYLQAQACRLESLRRPEWAWTARISLATALEYIRKRAYSFTVGVPAGAHKRACGELQAELERQGGLDREVEVANDIRMVLAERP